MRALKMKPTIDEKERLDQTCRRLLEQAELIKATGQWGPKASDTGSRPLPKGSAQVSGIKLKEPTSTRALSRREHIILLERSKLHGFAFWPWKSDPTAADFELKPGENLFLYVLYAVVQAVTTFVLLLISAYLAKLEIIRNYGFLVCKWKYSLAGRGLRMSCPLPNFETL